MPHEVIMPALGMAQDTGLLVAWLKGAGDPVKAGDALMEVETDKATMEVEAAHDGYLTNLSAQAGQDVPVGQVVAMISETPEGTADAPAGTSSTPPPADDSETVPDGRGVIMPALGMAQDTGLIVGWSKAPGDAVGADDVLLEVETDKSTMEVPAGFDGYVAALLAAEGEAVPVGEVIAVISPQKPERTMQRSRADDAAPAAAPEPSPVPKQTTPAAPPAPKAAPNTPAPAPSGGRIFASPKARRLAAEQGLDLARLVGHGLEQPFHVADLETLRTLPAASAAAAPTAQTGTPQRLTADLPGAAWANFLIWLADETGQTDRHAAALATFAAGALAEAGADTGAILIETAQPAAQRSFVPEPGHPIATLAATEAGTAPAPAAILRDLTGTAITGLQFGADATPVLSLTRQGDRLCATYEGRLPPGQAIAFLNGFAARLADPLRHIL